MYPLTYEEFKNKLLDIFSKEDCNKLFTDEGKQDFISNHEFDFHESYEHECENYDDKIENIFDNPEIASEYMLGLIEDCHSYCIERGFVPQIEKVDEIKYPMTYDEFLRILREKIYQDAVKHNISPEEVQEFIDSEFRLGTDDGYYYYKISCEAYDKYKSENHPAADCVFTPRAIGGYHVSGINATKFLYL